MDSGVGLDFLKRLARGIAAQFGPDCEVVVHDLTGDSREHTVAAIENGHVSGRSVGDGPSQVVLEALQGGAAEDRLGYFTQTGDGRVLRSSTIFIHDGEGRATHILSINHDIGKLLAAEQAVRALTGGHTEAGSRPPAIPTSVHDLLDQLLAQSVESVGKPAALMTKDDKARAIRFLNDRGAFLITRAGDRISKFFGISKYTMYSYFDAKESKGDAQD